MVLAGALVVLVALGSAACHESYPACYVGDHQICVCGEGAVGYQACLADESGFGACVCDGKTPGPDGGAR
ncbi:MAG: hypothetical protein U0235_22200 [Polyangiaceae bacterium]